MIKLIKTKPHKSVIKTIICKQCGATLQYTPNDVKEYHGTDYGGGPDGMKWIDCPQCKNRAIIESW